MSDHELSSLSDAELARIAYGPASSDEQQSVAAARVLAARNSTRVVSRDEAASSPGTDANPAPALPAGNSAEDADRADDQTVDERTPLERPRPTRSVRLRTAASISLAVGSVALLGGLALGSAAETAQSNLQPDSLAVFDRAATAGEVAAMERLFGSRSDADGRLLARMGDVRAYGVLVTDTAYFGAPTPGREVCVVALTEGETYYPQSCMPEAVFRERGMIGSLPVSGARLPLSAPGVLSFSWGPRGGIELSDDTELVFGPPESRFSDAELAEGVDLPALRTLELSPTVQGIDDPQLADAYLGPVQVGRYGPTVVLATVTLVDNDERRVCLYPVRDAEPTGSFCASLAQFRADGLTGEFTQDSATISVTWQPDGDVSFTRQRAL